MIKRLIFFAAVFLVLILIVTTAIIFFSKKNICRKCNVILVSIDTLSANHLPCYGYERNTASNLCKFAKENILFTNSYSQSTWTLPSHFSIFTSLYPSTHRILTELKDELKPKYKTLTETLQKEGYETLYYGPRGDWALPLDKGIGRGFDFIENNYFYADIKHWDEGIEKLLNNQKKGKPTFLFLHTYYVHGPYFVGKKKNLRFTSDYFPQIPLTPEEFNKAFTQEFFDYMVKSYTERLESSETKESLDRNTLIVQGLKKAKSLKEAEQIAKKLLPENELWTFRYRWYYEQIDLEDPRQLEYVRALYDERIYDLDRDIQKLLALVKGPLSKNTVLIITSDHGEGFGEHKALGHSGKYSERYLYNEILRVPLIMAVPGVKKVQSDDLAQNIDLYPTLLKLTGISPPSYLEGTDLTGLIFGLPFAKRNPQVIAELNLDKKVLIDYKWKLNVKNMDRLYDIESLELYNLLKDKSERKNVASSFRDVVAEKLKEILGFVFKKDSYSTDINYDEFPSWIDEEKRKKLIEEGYF